MFLKYYLPLLHISALKKKKKPNLSETSLTLSLHVFLWGWAYYDSSYIKSAFLKHSLEQDLKYILKHRAVVCSSSSLKFEYEWNISIVVRLCLFFFFFENCPSWLVNLAEIKMINSCLVYKQHTLASWFPPLHGAITSSFLSMWSLWHLMWQRRHSRAGGGLNMFHRGLVQASQLVGKW